MHLLILSHEYEPIPSGGVTLVRELSRHLVPLGWRVTIITPRLPDMPAREEPLPGITVVRINTGRRTLGNATMGELAAFGVLSLLPAWRLARREGVDVILSLFLVPAGFTATWVSLLSGVPHATFIGGSDLPGVESRFSRLLDRLAWLLRWLLNRADRVLAAEGLVETVARIAPSARLQAVWPGTHLPEGITPRPAPPATAEHPLRLLTIGRLIPRKGFLHILEAMALLPEAQRRRLHLTIVGYGPLEMALREGIAQHGLAGHVTLAGKVAKADLDDYYRAADVYLYYTGLDGQSLALVEALGWGLPIVTSDVPGNREQLRDNGLLIPWDDPPALARGLETLLGRAGELPAWSRASLAHAQRYRWQRVAARYSEALGACVAAGAHRSPP